MHQTFIQSQLGKERPVLWETAEEGWTDNYIRLRAPHDPNRINTISPITLTPDNIIPTTHDN